MKKTDEREEKLELIKDWILENTDKWWIEK